MARLTTRTLWLVIVCSLTGFRGVSAGDFSFHHENVMGTSMELVVHADGEASARRAEARVLHEIDRLTMVLSNHVPDSEFRRWQAGPIGEVAVSPDLRSVLGASDLWRERSGGAFDPRVQMLSRLWADAARLGRVPSTEMIAARVRQLRHPAWRIGSDGVAKRLSGDPLTLDAIAKGYIVERAASVGLDRADGVTGLLLNVGGDLRAAGDFDARIGVTSPLADSETSEPAAIIEVRDRAVATSGRSQRFFQIGGRRYSHIIDPRTGWPAVGAAGATVIARSSTDADALATILNVVSPEEGLRLVDSIDDAACMIFAADSKVFRSRLWGRFEMAAPLRAVVANRPDEGTWDENFELAIDYEIGKPDGNNRRYRRPYVAIWVEDKDGKAVRTITLWLSLGGSGPDRWVPDLKRWYPADQERKKRMKTDLVYTIARATRQPGTYSSIWDGKDDGGTLVKAGDYTINIETAREHGTYQIIKTPITVDGKPFDKELKGNAEIKSASISYRRKADAK